MAWGTVTIGGIPFRETRVAEEGDDDLRIAGQESDPPSSSAHVVASHHNVRGLFGAVVPVTFTDKAHLAGFFRVADVRSVLTNVHAGLFQKVDWSLTLVRLGSARDLEVESQVPTFARPDELAGTQVPSFWHAPAVGTTSYWTGPTVPTGIVSRASSEGTVQVFTGIPTSVPPRWAVSVEDYLKGSSRILLDGIRRATNREQPFTPPHEAWELQNGLVRVQGAASGAVTVSAWDSGTWASAKGYQFTVAGVPLTATPELSILRNDPEEVRARLTYPSAPGRVTVDLSLRRGARFVTGMMKRHSVAALGVVRTSAEAATSVTGGLTATDADADGNRFVMGSTRAVTAATTTAAISKAAVTAFDFFLGHEVGSPPAAGDAFADLLAQYIGTSGELARIVRR